MHVIPFQRLTSFGCWVFFKMRPIIWVRSHAYINIIRYKAHSITFGDLHSVCSGDGQGLASHLFESP